MFVALITNSASKILFTALLNIVLLAVFAFIYILVIKMKKANWFNAISFRQNFIAFSVALYIFALLPIYLSGFVWGLTFICLREVVFRKDEIRKYQLYSKYGKSSGKSFPKIENLSQLKETFFPINDTKLRYKDFKYSFLSYSNTSLWLIVFLLLNLVELSKTVNALYFAEIIIIASIIFIFIGRFVYQITFYNPNSISFCSELGTLIVVTLIGIIYYFVIIAILFKIHGMTLFSF